MSFQRNQLFEGKLPLTTLSLSLLPPLYWALTFFSLIRLLKFCYCFVGAVFLINPYYSILFVFRDSQVEIGEPWDVLGWVATSILQQTRYIHTLTYTLFSFLFPFMIPFSDCESNEDSCEESTWEEDHVSDFAEWPFMANLWSSC